VRMEGVKGKKLGGTWCVKNFGVRTSGPSVGGDGSGGRDRLRKITSGEWGGPASVRVLQSKNREPTAANNCKTHAYSVGTPVAKRGEGSRWGQLCVLLTTPLKNCKTKKAERGPRGNAAREKKSRGVELGRAQTWGPRKDQKKRGQVGIAGGREGKCMKKDAAIGRQKAKTVSAAGTDQPARWKNNGSTAHGNQLLIFLHH